MSATAVNDSNFDTEVLNSSPPVLVDFWAEWCGPCIMLGPVIEELAKEIGDKVKVVKMNIDESPLTPERYGVRSIPTLILFKDGQPIDTKIGSHPKGKLREWVEASI